MNKYQGERVPTATKRSQLLNVHLPLHYTFSGIILIIYVYTANVKITAVASRLWDFHVAHSEGGSGKRKSDEG